MGKEIEFIFLEQDAESYLSKLCDAYRNTENKDRDPNWLNRLEKQIL